MADSGPAGDAAESVQAPRPGSSGPGPHVYFQSPPEAAGKGPRGGGADDKGPARHQGKVTVKYNRKELRKRLNLEHLTCLYDCQEEEIPELEVDGDELLDMESDDARTARVRELLVDSYKPTEAFISGLLDKIRGTQKLSTPQKKGGSPAWMNGGRPLDNRCPPYLVATAILGALRSAWRRSIDTKTLCVVKSMIKVEEMTGVGELMKKRDPCSLLMEM
ncbi:protein phosphatase 1 regulatory subunit 14B-like [Sorex araneus]|uniref:protein phosphatase 1 regulatory subunit 14B-like n=1 Tax=Sorex araneus TaxID=42254 RepID=UPI0024339159|nr:protein phosphatase 1 regulatory subunit 14B-like [Sorex araneus]